MLEITDDKTDGDSSIKFSIKNRKLKAKYTTRKRRKRTWCSTLKSNVTALVNVKLLAIVTSLLNVYDSNYVIVILTDNCGFLKVNLWVVLIWVSNACLKIRINWIIRRKILLAAVSVITRSKRLFWLSTTFVFCFFSKQCSLVLLYKFIFVLFLLSNNCCWTLKYRQINLQKAKNKELLNQIIMF